MNCIVDMNDNVQTIASRSAHPGGVISCRGDGSVTFYSNSINIDVWRALCSSRGGEVIDATDL